MREIVRPFDWHDRSRQKALGKCTEGFDGALKALEVLPRRSLPRDASATASFRIQPNSAFILMWMSKAKPELEDVANSLKEVFEQFDVRATRADDIEHQDVITDVILRHIRESEFLIERT